MLSLHVAKQKKRGIPPGSDVYAYRAGLGNFSTRPGSHFLV